MIHDKSTYLYVAKTLPFVFERVENVMKKGENTGYHHFLVLPHCFLQGKAQISSFNHLPHNPFENIVGKGENAGNQHFLLFPQFFYPSQKQFLFLSYIYFLVCKCFQFGRQLSHITVAIGKSFHFGKIQFFLL